MLQVICDRCGVTLGKTAPPKPVEVQGPGALGRGIRKDLCDGCISRLIDFFKPLPSHTGHVDVN